MGKNDFVLVYFSLDNTYTVINDDKKLLENQKKVKIEYKGKWPVGKILYRAKGENMQLGELVSTDTEFEVYSSPKKTNKRKFNDINQDLAEVENYLSSREVIPTTSSNSSNDICLVLTEIQDLKSKFEQMMKMINELLEGSRKKGRSNDWPTEIIWNGKNLLDISASSWNKYITALYEVLFTQEEMKTGTVILPGEATKSTRPRLSEEKCELLKRCAIAKATPPSDKVEQTWKDAKNIANRKCLDQKKK
ncbi:unnamed protein product [Brachionus calyciflorus]|uniref:BEN domain-containing protein n=1 Tax=Brachionus calyciflorus TaxID=104777 RepID=A0A814NP27_9BILA|nr:unnamed protein product [Brachionus calyciflorus]